MRVTAIGLSGFLLTLFAMIVACVPPTGTPSVLEFELKVMGGALLFVLVGMSLYAWRHRTVVATA